ncbi:MAG: hypothetical protein J0I87_16240, partial [Cellulomonas sp.]|nr:hypothetical protein [Cellulomonas sp.]
MSGAVAQVANLYPYLVAEEGHRDHQAEEALFLTFNVDLGYLEVRLLGALRASGARVTVLADAGVWAPDVRAVNLAGLEYHVGLADQATAFHPKLTVLVGPQRVLAAVGSGNLTTGGWQYNRELLTVFTGDREGVPMAVRDIRNALNALEGTVRTDGVTARAVQRTVALLDDLLNVAPPIDTGHRVHASWVAPLIDQLPAGDVAELCLTAAFHDPDASAVRRLIARMRPRRVRVAVQPGWTHVDAAALDSVLADHAATTGATVELLRDPESIGTQHARYRHGKLIEWVTLEGDRRAMTGSPNLTSVAFLRRAGLGGNFELAVTGPVPDTLFPGGEPVDALSVPVLVGERDTTATEGGPPNVQVLSAVTKDDTLTIHLNRPADSDVPIEGAARQDHPDVWSTVGLVPAGVRTATFAVVSPPGSRVRAVMPDGNPTAAMFVTGERKVLTRTIPTAQRSRLHRANVNDLFGEDLGLLELLQTELAAFALDATTAHTPMVARATSGGSDDGESHHGAEPIQPWLWLQDRATERLGSDIASWLLAVPKAGPGDSGAVPWADIITDEQAAGLDSDEAAADVDETLTAIDHTDANAEVIDHSGDPERTRRARRRACVKWAANAVLDSPFRQLGTLGVTLRFWSTGNWDVDDPEPFTLVRNLLAALVTADLPAEIAQRAASLAAIGLTM